MSKYIVGERCVGCGLCVGTCPEVFEMTQTSYQAHAKDIETEDPKAKEALRSCPVGAIRIKARK